MVSTGLPNAVSPLQKIFLTRGDTASAYKMSGRARMLFWFEMNNSHLGSHRRLLGYNLARS